MPVFSTNVGLKRILIGVTINRTLNKVNTYEGRECMYQCPNCGGRLVFDIPSQSMLCEHCSTNYNPYNLGEGNSAEESTEYDVTVFKCPQCGGEIMSTDNTIANFCSFCGASTVLESRISKQLRPGYIIPFSKNKQDCKNEYKKMMKRAWFAPKELKDEKYIDGFRGIYMPYWAYHVTQKGPVVLKGEKSTRHGDYIYTDHYDIKGDMDCQYKGISFDASSSFDDNISEAIAPFDVKNMAGFTPAFLSGFYADTADVGCDVYMNDALDMAGEETYDYVKHNIPLGGVSLHESESTINSKCNSKIETIDRTLYPVWFLSYRNRDRVAYATVNGQTGKVSADLPVSVGRYFAGSALLAVPIFILLNMFFTLRPKVTLNVAAVIALITIILYVFELGKIKRRDQKLDDRGSWEESKLCNRKYGKDAKADNNNLAQQMADGRNNARINRINKDKKDRNSSLLKAVVIFAIFIFAVPNFMFVLSIFDMFFSSGFSFFISAACFVAGVVVTITSKKTYKEVSGGKAVPGSFGALVAMGISTVILIINPVSDLYYYGAVIFVLIALMFTLVELIKYYNVLATRRLPQFDNYKGGNDNA